MVDREIPTISYGRSLAPLHLTTLDASFMAYSLTCVYFSEPDRPLKNVCSMQQYQNQARMFKQKSNMRTRKAC